MDRLKDSGRYKMLDGYHIAMLRRLNWSEEIVGKLVNAECRRAEKFVPMSKDDYLINRSELLGVPLVGEFLLIDCQIGGESIFAIDGDGRITGENSRSIGCLTDSETRALFSIFSPQLNELKDRGGNQWTD